MKIGAVGYGLMGSAILKGLVNSGTVKAEDILVSGRSDKTRLRIENDGFSLAPDNGKAAACDILLIAVPPQKHASVCREIAPAVRTNHTVIWTIAAGITLAQTEELLGDGTEIVRTMPNICATVGSSMTGVSFNEHVTEGHRELLLKLIREFGSSVEIREEMMDRIVPVTGSSPAMIFMLIDAMANAAAMQGFNWEDSVRLSAETVKGCAEMALQSGKHPAQLQNQVCTPGGLTLEMVKKLEEDGFRNAVLDGMLAVSK
ncbi:MAG: pyrroline-5-carboxylate reductase [Eubacterium sp.]